MEIFINTQGTATKLSPQHVYQGTNVSQINLYAPFPSQTRLSVAFMLPDGTTTPYYQMTFTGITSDDAPGINLWQYVMPLAITQDAGAARVAFLATFNENGTATQQTSSYVDFTIEQSALPVLPDEPTPDVWTQILSYLSAQDTKIATIQSDVADIEQVADKANTNADAAVTTATQAKQTANEAKTTADGIDEKATQALANSQTAEQTANEAKTTADGLADSIAQANENANNAVTIASQANATANEAKKIAEDAAQENGTKVSVGGAFQQTLTFASDPQAQITANKNAIAEAQSDISDIVSGAQTAKKAEQDANGNNIADTYAKLSQVVRTDTAQGLNSTQQLQAQNNIYPAVTDLNNVPLPFAICSQVFTFSVNTANAPTTDGGTLIQSVFDTVNGGFFTQTAIMNTEGGGEIYTRRCNGSSGFTNWQRYMSIDPTTLTPSTANGWTQTTATGSLPSSGVYMVAPNGGLNYGIGIMFYAAPGSAISPVGGGCSLSHTADNDNKWRLYNDDGTEATLAFVYYKRIA